MLRDTSAGLRLAAVNVLLLSILVLGALGLIVLNWEWSGWWAGVAGLLITVIAYRRTRLVGFLAWLGFFAGLTVMETWQLWRLRGDTEAIDPLLVMGLFASFAGLLIGGLAATLLSTRRPARKASTEPESFTP